MIMNAACMHACINVYDMVYRQNILKMNMPILTCIFFTFNLLTLTSEMHFVKFHPEV